MIFFVTGFIVCHLSYYGPCHASHHDPRGTDSCHLDVAAGVVGKRLRHLVETCEKHVTARWMIILQGSDAC
ncbi:hypothetical protein F5I97DRAFT_1914171 [Phlebopus sp. FC_14]|nr:hypothetical protein F5I97DRAFT_1914171 [Phlebopus sp. FC_14]